MEMSRMTEQRARAHLDRLVFSVAYIVLVLYVYALAICNIECQLAYTPRQPAVHFE